MALASPSDRLPTSPLAAGSSSLFRLGLLGLAAIWTSVIVISAFAPDNVSGSQQEHIPLAAFVTWVWGLFASRSMITLLVGQRAHPERFADVRVLVAGIAVVWAIAAAVGVFGPEMVTGSDPTRTPIAALLAPIAAMVLTTTGCQLFGTVTGDSDKT